MTLRTAVCTIVSKSGVAHARTLMASLAVAEPGWDRVVLLVDRLEGALDPSAEGFALVDIDDLGIRDGKQMLFRDDIRDASAAAKPWLLDWLLHAKGYARVVYLDPHTFVYGPMTPVTEAWDERAMAVLTPHLTGRLRDDRRPAEIDILRAGTYSSGFIALAQHPSLRALLDYWQEKSIPEPGGGPDAGPVGDQKWFDLVPGLFEDVRILRDPGCNVAHWNLAHRALRWAGRCWTVNGAPLVFFQFSGLDPAAPATVSKDQDRFDLETIGEARELILRYSSAVLANGFETCRRWAYAFGCFDDGTRIPDAFRVAHRRIPELRALAGGDPFAAGPEVFNRAWVEGDAGPSITWAMRAVWDASPRVQADFPDPAGVDRRRFHDWFVDHGARAFDIPAAFVPGRSAGALPTRHGEQKGFHARTAWERAAGLSWMGNRATIPLAEAAGRSGMVHGVHRADLFDQAGLDRTLEVRAEIEGRVVGAIVLTEGGPFTLPFHVPAPASREVMLQLVASQAFVPASAGLGADPRVLAVQVRSIELGGVVVFGTDALGAPPAVIGDRSRLSGDYSGFYPRDGTALREGAAWMGPDARVRIPSLAAGATLVIVGDYQPHGMVLTYGNGRTRVDVKLDGQRLYRAEFEAPGEFRIEATVPRPLSGADHRPRVLALVSDRHFVPARAGMGEDVRALVARIRRIEVDGEAVLDFSRRDPWYPDGPAANPAPVGVNIIGYARGESGLGQSARGAAASCEAAGVPFALFDFHEGLGAGREGHSSWSTTPEALLHPVNVFHINADQMAPVAHWRRGSVLEARYNVGCWHWELQEIPDDWLSGFDVLDEIWAPSRFIMEAVAAKSPVPVVHLPHGIEFAVRADARRSHFGLPERTFLFLMMYDTRSDQARKNPEAVLDAWTKAFAPDRDDVGLVIKTTYSEADPEGYAKLRDRVAGMANVRLLAERYDRQTTYDLHSLVDCYVQLHRSEGWGLNLSESMVLGKPVIGTNWSGNTDFMNPANSCAVGYRLVQLERDHGPFRKGQVWADPDIEHAAWFMRKLVEEPDYARDTGLRGRETMRRDFSHRAAGARYRRRLEIIRRLI